MKKIYTDNLNMLVSKQLSKKHKSLDNGNLINFPGITASVIFSDGSVWNKAVGYSSESILMQSDMFFGVGSITMTYISILVLQMLENGILSLDDSVNKYITLTNNQVGELKIRQLLNHTSCLYPYQTSSEYLDAIYSKPSKVWEKEEILTNFLKGFIDDPKVKFVESAMNYILLGIITEKITGHKIHNHLEKMFVKYNLKNTFLYPQQTYNTKDMAHMWWDIDNSGKPVDIMTENEELPLAGLFSSLWTAGAIHTNSAELAQFIRMLFNCRFFNKETLEIMLSPSFSFNKSSTYGYGVVVEKINDEQIYWHPGGVGFSSIYMHNPQKDLTVSLLCNVMIDLKPIALEILECVNFNRS